jgi:type VI secretion system protein ImpC
MADAKNEKEVQAGTTEAQAELTLVEEILRGPGGYDPLELGYKEARAGLEAIFIEMLRPERSQQRVDRRLVDDMIATVDRRLSLQLDEVLHQKDLQTLESTWRGLKLLVDKTDFRENNKIEILNVTKQDLIDDFEDTPEITKSGLYKTVYSAEYGTFGGKPFGALIGNYDFGPGPQDMALLQKIASVSAMAHAPFIAAASPKFFGEDSFLRLPNLKDIKAIMEGPQYIKWRSFRESEDSRYVALTLPRFLLRLPYGPDSNPIKSFNYEERVSGSHDHYLWGNTSFAFATRLADSFAKYRWCPNIIGPKSGGAVEDLPLHQFEAMGDIQTKIPTEVLISGRREYELADEGFIALTMRKGSDNAAFFSANSCQKPKFFGISPAGKEAETNYKLGTQLPYMFIVSRLAHYIKVLQTEHLASWTMKTDLERELNTWISQYVSDMEAPPPSVRSKRPLRAVQIKVEDVEGDPGWYRVDLKVSPHIKYMGASFTLGLVGKLDKK